MEELPKTELPQGGRPETTSIGLLNLSPTWSCCKQVDHAKHSRGWLKLPPNVRFSKDAGHGIWATRRGLHAQITPLNRSFRTPPGVAESCPSFDIAAHTLPGVLSSTVRFALTTPLTTSHTGSDTNCSGPVETYPGPAPFVLCSMASRNASRKELQRSARSRKIRVRVTSFRSEGRG